MNFIVVQLFGRLWRRNPGSVPHINSSPTQILILPKGGESAEALVGELFSPQFTVHRTVPKENSLFTVLYCSLPVLYVQAGHHTIMYNGKRQIRQ